MEVRYGTHRSRVSVNTWVPSHPFVTSIPRLGPECVESAGLEDNGEISLGGIQYVDDSGLMAHKTLCLASSPVLPHLVCS